MTEQKTKSGLQKWSVMFERECYEEARAIIHYPIEKSKHGSFVGVAEVDCLPIDTDHPDAEDIEEIPLVREGYDAERLRNVCMIVHAPEMLEALREAHQKLRELLVEEVVIEEDKYGPSIHHRTILRNQLLSEECWELWRYLVTIADGLEEAASILDTEMI